MDFCVVDWGIVKDIVVAFIGAGVPSFVAICVYRTWRNQKGSEVIASETRQVIKNLLEMARIVSSMEPDIYHGGIQPSQFDRLNLLFEITISDLLYIDDCILVNDLKSGYDEFAKIANNVRKNNSSNSLEIKAFGGCAINLVNILKPYSIHAIKFKFR